MKFTYFTILFFFLAVFTYGQGHTYSYTNFTFTRALAMGGAFTAVEDALESALFNPAALRSDLYGQSAFDLYINPLGTADAAKHRDDLTTRNSLNARDAAGLAGTFFRAATFAQPVFQFSVILSEQLPNNPFTSSTDGKNDTKYILDWHYHAASARVALAKQVSLGATAYAFNSTDEQSQQLTTKLGSSYGILMKPNESFSAGISFFSFPEGPDTLMFQQHRISNKSINVGIAYRLAPYLKGAFDFRNVSQEENNSTNEIHAGLELQPASMLAIRTGYFRNYDSGIDTYSFGLGLADFRTYKTRERFVLSRIILNYGVQMEYDPEYLQLAHYLTFQLRL